MKFSLIENTEEGFMNFLCQEAETENEKVIIFNTTTQTGEQ
jgi:hypothetical protein